MNPTRLKQKNAFTLIELLASIAILVLLTTIVFGIFNQASRAWLLGESRTETFQATRLALEMMATELETAIATSNAVSVVSGKRITYLHLDASTGLNTGDTRVETTPPNDAIFFIANTSDSVGKDYVDLTEHGYFVVFINTDAHTMKKGYYYLLRKQTRSDASSGWDFFTKPTDWYTTPTIPGGSIVASTLCTPILDNVVRFWVRYEDAASTTQGTDIRDNWPHVDRLPRAIHLRMSVLDRRYAGRLSAIRPNGLTQAELGLVPYNASGDTIENLSDQALKSILRDGLRTFFRTVYPRNAS